MATQAEIQAVREQVEGILERARNDQVLATQLKTGPEEALRAMGVPEWALGQVSREMSPSEVEGYLSKPSLPKRGPFVPIEPSGRGGDSPIGGCWVTCIITCSAWSV